MGKRRRNAQPTTLVTPTLDLSGGGGFVASDDSTKAEPTYWKQVLPEATIQYRHMPDDEPVELSFDREGNQELIDAFHGGAMDQTSFLLAPGDNSHTMDAERWRGQVVDMRQARDGEDPGLYAKIKFGSKKAAKAVINNPSLGVSARIRPGVENARTGAKFGRAIIHVLGTLDPKITGMSGWTPATDLSVSYASRDVIDLSATTYSEAAVAKNGKTDKVKTTAKTGTGSAGERLTAEQFATMGPDDLEAAQLDEAEIARLVDALDDDQLAGFLTLNESLVEPGDDDSDDDSDDDDDDDSDSDSDSDSNDDDDTSNDDANGRVPAGAGADMSNAAQQQIDLANQRADAAQRDARKALNQQAAITWQATRQSLLAQGVPPYVIDMAQPALSATDDMVVDLSNVGGPKGVNYTKIIRQLVEDRKGEIDLSEIDLGHGDADGDDQYAAERAAIADWDV